MAIEKAGKNIKDLQKTENKNKKKRVKMMLSLGDTYCKNEGFIAFIFFPSELSLSITFLVFSKTRKTTSLLPSENCKESTFLCLTKALA